MCWELEMDPNRVSVVLGARVVGIRTVTLAEPNEGGFDRMKVVETIKASTVPSMGHFLRKSAEMAEAAGVYRQYELRIHDCARPYVSVYERCQRKHIGVFVWSSDTEPLNSQDERMQLLACKLDEYSQRESCKAQTGDFPGMSDIPVVSVSERRPIPVPKRPPLKERTLRMFRNALCFCGSGHKYKHCCMSKDLKETTSAQPAYSVSRRERRTVEQMNITGEADHIAKCAGNGDARMVLLGHFIFFSTETRDAWILESRDRFAVCLMQDGERQSFRIVETTSNFTVEWDGRYQIHGSAFVVTKESGEVVIRFDYPTEQIVQMTRSFGKG
jgi:hypothetical protein